MQLLSVIIFIPAAMIALSEALKAASIVYGRMPLGQ